MDASPKKIFNWHRKYLSLYIDLFATQVNRQFSNQTMQTMQHINQIQDSTKNEVFIENFFSNCDQIRMMMMILDACTPPLRGGVQSSSIIILWLKMQGNNTKNMVRLPPFPNQPPHRISSYLQSFFSYLLKVLVFRFQPIKNDLASFNQSQTTFYLLSCFASRFRCVLRLTTFGFRAVMLFLGDFFKLLLQQYLCVCCRKHVLPLGCIFSTDF